MDERSENHLHACGIRGAHVGKCNECGKTAELGWAHVCEDCWDFMTGQEADRG